MCTNNLVGPALTDQAAFRFVHLLLPGRGDVVMRRYDDPIEVRSVEVAAASPARVAEDTAQELVDAPGGVGSPQAFIWRGRLYVVRQVLGHWRERRAWWRAALDPAPVPCSGIGVASCEQRVWRVEASPGRARGTGVFDLVHDDIPEAGQAHWRLVRVAD